MGFFDQFINQTADPDSFLGSLMRYGTNRLHAKALIWGLSNLELPDPKEIAELGCGSGKNVAVLLAQFPQARVTAVEPSPFSIEKATANNSRAISAGRCIVERGSLTDLRLEKEHYDLAVAFETVYSWPDLKSCFSQALKILKPGGGMVIVNETDGNEAVKIRIEKNNEGMTCYTEEEIREALLAAGFSEAESFHHPSEPWIAVSAKKEAAFL